MMTWFERYKTASRETKFFVLNAILYAFLIIASTLFCYLRLDYVRSYKTTPITQTKNIKP